jgi:hypothetical protein
VHGSSPISGEGGPFFEEEVVVVSEAVAIRLMTLILLLMPSSKLVCNHRQQWARMSRW